MLVLARQYLNVWIDRPFESNPPLLGQPQPALPNTTPRAFFELLGGQPVVLYREQVTLKLWTGPQAHPMTDLQLEHRRLDQSTALLLIAGPSIEQCLTYPIVGMIEDDFTTMTDPEDFDFGLFLTNIRADPERQSLLFPPRQTAP